MSTKPPDIICNRPVDPADIHGFDLEGYRYHTGLSSVGRPVFTHRTSSKKSWLS